MPRLYSLEMCLNVKDMLITRFKTEEAIQEVPRLHSLTWRTETSVPHKERAAGFGTSATHLQINTQKLSDANAATRPLQSSGAPGKPQKQLRSHLIWTPFVFKLCVLMCVPMCVYVHLSTDALKCSSGTIA